MNSHFPVSCVFAVMSVRVFRVGAAIQLKSVAQVRTQRARTPTLRLGGAARAFCEVICHIR